MSFLFAARQLGAEFGGEDEVVADCAAVLVDLLENVVVLVWRGYGVWDD